MQRLRETKMLIGVPKEVKDHEYRVGLTPESVAEIVSRGHKALVETTAGLGIGASDVEYQENGAEIADSAEEVFARADMIVKVKEPQAEERSMLRDGQILYAYLHLAPDLKQTKDLLDSGAICIAYETVTSSRGDHPLLKPMSQIAGRMSIQAGAHALEKASGGRGVLLGGVPGILPGKTLIIGGGVAGFNAALMATGMNADVTIVDNDAATLERLSEHFSSRARAVKLNKYNLDEFISTSDLIVGCVHIHGATTPKLVTRDKLKTMKAGAVIVDVAIDQGGCFETSRPTTHTEPTYILDGIVHYCVPNMPGAVARTSTYALNNATLSHALTIASKGWKQAMRNDPYLRDGLSLCAGRVTCAPIAAAHNYTFYPPQKALEN